MLLSIQYLRAFAALAVVALHTGWSHTQLGHIGVDVFFVISGFIMVHVSRRETSPAAFLHARALRIVPLYWLLTAAWLPVEPASADRLLRSLAFLPTTDHPVLRVGWTMQFEVLFYLVFAACLLVPARARLWVLTAALTSAAAAHVALRLGDPMLSAWTDPIMLEFVAGAWLCRLRHLGWLRSRAAAPLLLAAATGFATHLGGPAPESAWRALTWGAPAFALVAGCVALEDARNVPRLPFLLLLGDASYAIYLSHWSLIHIRGYVASLPAPAAVSLILAGAIVLGVAVHLLIEKPIAARLRERRQRVRLGVQAQGT